MKGEKVVHTDDFEQVTALIKELLILNRAESSHPLRPQTESRLRIQTPSLLLFGRLALDSGFEDLPLVANCWPIRKESTYNGPQSHAPKRLLEIAGTQSKTKDDIATCCPLFPPVPADRLGSLCSFRFSLVNQLDDFGD
jgi:hypothetical protein